MGELEVALLTNGIVALVSAAAGAFAGGYGADRAVRRRERKRRLLDELRATNAATSVAFNIANSAIALKVQLLKPLLDKYETATQAFSTAAKLHAGGDQRPFEYVMDLQKVDSPIVPIEQLQRALFERAPILGRPQFCAGALTQAADGLARALTDRNDVIDYLMQNTETLSQLRKAQLYFGSPDDQGNHDLRYSSAMEGIRHHIDSVIFFSALISTDMASHAKKVREKFPKKAKMLITPNFDKPKKDGLFPPDESFADFLAMPCEATDSVLLER